MEIRCEKCWQESDERYFRYGNNVYCYACEDELKRDGLLTDETLKKFAKSNVRTILISEI